MSLALGGLARPLFGPISDGISSDAFGVFSLLFLDKEERVRRASGSSSSSSRFTTIGGVTASASGLSAVFPHAVGERDQPERNRLFSSILLSDS